MSGQVISMQPLFQNYSYEQRFYAPALQCFGANESIINDLTASVDEGFAVEAYLQFLAFTPATGVNLNGNLTDWDDATVYSGKDEVSQDVFRMFIVPNTTTPLDLVGTNYSNLNETIECHLQNASYTTNVSFHNGLQDIQLLQVDLLDAVAPVLELGPNGAYQVPGGISQSDSLKASYTSIMLAFTRILVGYSQESHYGGYSTSYTSFDMTSIDWTTRGSAIQGLEELFQNLTLSVLAVPDLIKNETSAEKVAVDILTYPLTYIFEPMDILIAYGLAFGLALVSVASGIHAVFSQGGSFQNIFSTFLRLTRAANLDVQVQTPDDGMDPLPKSVAETKLRLSGVRN